MFTFFLLSTLLLSIGVEASPLGSRAIARRHNGIPLARRFILQSRVNSPPSCAASPVATQPLATLAAGQNSTSTSIASSVATSTTAASGASDNSTTADATPVVTSSAPANTTAPLNITTSSKPAVVSLTARFAQSDLVVTAQRWQDLCLASGGDIFTNQPCVNLAGIGGINALLEEADTCAQQDIADAMISFAKSRGIRNRKPLIDFAISYRKHARNAISIFGVIPSTMYCQRLAKNPELHGISNAQLPGVDRGLFGSSTVPIVPFGSTGTCPLGLTPDASACSCVNATSTSTGSNATTTGIDSSGNSTIVDSGATDTDTATATDSATLTDSAATTINTADATATDVSTDTSSATIDYSAAAASMTASPGTDSTTSSADDASSITTDATDSTTSDVAASATASDTASSAAATATAKTSGPNFQPPDISGDVNDTNG